MSDSPHRVPVRRAVTDLLRELGITTIFGNPGTTELGLLQDFPKDFHYVLGLQESVVVGMADGYAQATHNAAVVNLHSAAGVGHAMGNIFTAAKNQTPLIILAGQQSRSMLPFEPFLFSDRATELPRPYVKWSCEPARGEDVPRAIARGYYTAMQPPQGPVFVSVPADDWSCSCERLEVRRVSRAIRPDPELVAEIAKSLNSAASPAFVVGASVDREGAWNDVVALAELHRAKVWVAPMSGRNGFPEDHALFAGFLPAAREPIVRLLTGHDFVLVIGAPAFSYHVEGTGPCVPPGTTLAQLVDDSNQAAWTPVGISVLGSVQLGVRDLIAESTRVDRPWPPAKGPAASVDPCHPMSVDYVLQTLASVRDPGSIIVEEATSARASMHQHLPILRPETFYTMSSGGLGFGLPAAVGIALARPQEKVIALLGDGASMYSIQGLWSAAQLRLPVTFLILKNGRYAVLRELASFYGFGAAEAGALQGTDLPGIDFVGLARSMGCAAVRVDAPQDLRGALSESIQTRGPVVVEIDVA
ncbi:MAG: benzoylformate decarboxylase [Rhodanobacteraceae bacterium]